MPPRDFLKGYSLSVLNIDLYELSLWDWWVCYTIYWYNEQLKQRGDWERARLVAFYAAAPHSKKIKKYSDVVKFDWEKAKKSNMTKEEFYKLKEQLF